MDKFTPEIAKKILDGSPDYVHPSIRVKYFEVEMARRGLTVERLLCFIAGLGENK